MPFEHKFQNHNFENGFYTESSILKTPYNPEVIFIGTYNHGWSWNNSDFFYGRDMYMWTILANLILYNNNQLLAARSETNLIPTFAQLFEICNKGKITFADIVKGIKPAISAFEVEQQRCVIVDELYEWRSYPNEKGEYSDKHLDYMGESKWLDDNVDAIVQFINSTPTLKHVYFTFKSGSWIVDKLNKIKGSVRQEVNCCSIFTPTGNGFGKNLAFPFDKKASGIAHCWVWNNLDHPVNIARVGYGHLDHDWLRSKGVDVDNF